jgi:hypothetical protein
VIPDKTGQGPNSRCGPICGLGLPDAARDASAKAARVQAPEEAPAGLAGVVIVREGDAAGARD